MNRNALWGGVAAVALTFGSAPAFAQETLNLTVGGNEVGRVDAAVKDKNPYSQAYHAMGEDEASRTSLLDNQNPPPDAHIHLPNPSFYPLIAAIGLALVAVGMLFNNPVFHIVDMGVPVVTALGALLLVGGIYGWSFEPAD